MTSIHDGNVIPLFGEPPAMPIHPADALSFLQRRKPRGSGINHWAVKPCGDRERGSELAWELLHYVGANLTNGNVTPFQCVVADTMRNAHDEGRRDPNGLELGFLSTFGKFRGRGRARRTLNAAPHDHHPIGD